MWKHLKKTQNNNNNKNKTNKNKNKQKTITKQTKTNKNKKPTTTTTTRSPTRVSSEDIKWMSSKDIKKKQEILQRLVYFDRTVCDLFLDLYLNI